MKISLAVMALLGVTDAVSIKSKVHNSAKLHTKVAHKEKAMAQLNPYVAASIMETFDQNGNGTITEKEFLGMLKNLC